MEGVVVGDFQGATAQGALGGVYLQDPSGDGSTATSDGLFVSGRALDVQAGDAIRAVGTAGEAFGQTQLSGTDEARVCRDDDGVPAATALTLPASAEERERLEGMLVTAAASLAATETRNVENFGEITLSSGGVLRTPTEIAERGPRRRRWPPRTPGAPSCSMTRATARAVSPSPTSPPTTPCVAGTPSPA